MNLRLNTVKIIHHKDSNQKQKNISLFFVLINCSIIFGIFLFLGSVLMTLGTMIALSVFTTLIILTIIKKEKFSKFKFKIHPALVLFGVMPTSFLLIMSYEGLDMEMLPLQLVLSYNFSIVFLSLTIILPLAIYNKFSSTLKKSNYLPFVSIIIPVYNEEKVIERTIDSVLKIHYTNSEVIVVDNGSNDKSLEILEKYKNKIKILSELKKGKANAVNRGIKSSKGEILVVMDADTVVKPDSIFNIVQPFENNPNLGAVTGNIKIANPTNIHTKIQVLEYALASQISKAALASQSAVTIVSGAFGAFRRSAVLENNQSIFSNDTLTEDLDASISILKRGYTTTFASDAIAYTEAPTSIRDLIIQRTRWYRGLIQGYSKHPELLRKSQFGQLPGLLYFLMFNSSLVIPIVTIINIGILIPTIFLGHALIALEVVLLNMVIGGSLFALSIHLDNNNQGYMKFYPVAFVYLRITDFIFIKVMLEHAFGKKVSWGNLTREGKKLDYEKLSH